VTQVLIVILLGMILMVLITIGLAFEKYFGIIIEIMERQERQVKK